MRKLVLVLLSLLASCLVMAQPKLPEPLKLPPGLEETLPISKANSYFGNAAKIQDCPEDKDNPLGVCNNVLFGGLAMFVTPISGNIHIRFFPPIDNISKFEVTHPGGLRGDNTVEVAPHFYRFPVLSPSFSDFPDHPTRGELDLTTGVVRNLDYRLSLSTNVLDSYKRQNPKLTGTEGRFPGAYGSSIARFDQRPDGLLDFTFFGSTFLPLSNNQGGLGDDKIRVPLPFCSAPGFCRGMEAPGTSVRPRFHISTRDPEGPECGAACPDIPFNTTQVYTLSTYYTSTGDRFDELKIAELGGPTIGRNHLQGRLNVQFGEPAGDLVPVAVWALPADALLAEPPPAPLPGVGINAIGHLEFVRFPNYTFEPKGVALANDPFDFVVAALNLRTGKIIGSMLYRGLPVQDLLFAIAALNAGRIPLDPFRYYGPASFERGPNGSTIFRFNGDVFLNFETFIFPEPSYNLARGWAAPEGSRLNPFLKFQGTHGGEKATVVKSGEITNVRSSHNDLINFRYSIPCDVSNKNFLFEYTNGASDSQGGTFRMKALAAVSCTNARGSTARPGDADIVTFSGFGSWSKDEDVHLATVQVSTAPDSRYWSVQIDGGLVSSANIKPLEETFP